MATVVADSFVGTEAVLSAVRDGAYIESVAAVYSDSDMTGYLDTGVSPGDQLLSGLGDFLAAPPAWPGMQLEFVVQTGGTVLSDSMAPIEGLSLTRYIRGVIAESTANFRADSRPVFEAGLLSRSDAIAWAEVLLTARGDPPTQAEALQTLPVDMFPVVELGLTARSDAFVLSEAGITARMDLSVAVEALRSQAGDATVAAEVTGTLPAVRSNAFMALELLGTQRSDNALAEWLALFRGDAVAPSEAILLARTDPSMRAENTAISRGDIAPPLEASSAAARVDAFLPSEAQLSAVRDGAYIELVTAGRSDAAVAAEAGSTLRADPNIPAEAVAGAARADVSMPLEAKLTVLRGGANLEALAMVKSLLVVGDSKGPFEWIGAFRADGVPVAEWAALSASDRPALVEWFRTLAVDALPPIESSATAPAPVLFVARGRLR